MGRDSRLIYNSSNIDMSHSRQILTNTCAGQDRTFPNADISLMRRRTKTGINSDNESLWMGVLNIAQYVRQIEGTVKRLKAYHDLSMLVMDVPHVARCIKDMHKGETEAIPTPAIIISEVCRFYSLEEQVLRGTLKNKNTAEARQVAMYLCRKLTNLSLPDIGREFGRDHSTVLHGLNKIERLMADSTSGLQDNIRDITANINNKL